MVKNGLLGRLQRRLWLAGKAGIARVLAGDRMIAPGYVGQTLGTADLAELDRIVREALERAYRRAMVNGEMKADTREKFGALGESLADTRLHPIDVRQDTVAAVYGVDPRTMSLAEMVRYATDVSRQVAAVDARVKYNYVSTVTELSRELFVSSEGARIEDREEAAAQARRPRAQVPIIFSSSGTTWKRSPTRPMSATSKIGASESLLMATMVRASLMPVRCWMAPEIPTAT